MERPTKKNELNTFARQHADLLKGVTGLEKATAISVLQKEKPRIPAIRNLLKEVSPKKKGKIFKYVDEFGLKPIHDIFHQLRTDGTEKLTKDELVGMVESRHWSIKDIQRAMEITRTTPGCEECFATNNIRGLAWYLGAGKEKEILNDLRLVHPEDRETFIKAINHFNYYNLHNLVNRIRRPHEIKDEK